MNLRYRDERTQDPGPQSPSAAAISCRANANQHMVRMQHTVRPFKDLTSAAATEHTKNVNCFIAEGGQDWCGRSWPHQMAEGPMGIWYSVCAVCMVPP